MPLYDFKCDSCGTFHEAVVSIGTADHKCTNCGGIAKRVLLSPGERAKIKFHFNYMEP